MCPARRRSSTSVSAVGILGGHQRAAHRPGVLAVRHPAEEHRVVASACSPARSPCRARPGLLRSAPDCANQPAAEQLPAHPATAASISVRSVSARWAPSGQQRHISQREGGRPIAHRRARRCGCTAAGLRVPERRPRDRRRATGSRRAPHRARCRGCAAANRRPPWSRLRARRWRTPASGVNRFSIVSTTLASARLCPAAGLPSRRSPPSSPPRTARAGAGSRLPGPRR